MPTRLTLMHHIIRFLDVGDGPVFQNEFADILENKCLHLFHVSFSFVIEFN